MVYLDDPILHEMVMQVKSGWAQRQMQIAKKERLERRRRKGDGILKEFQRDLLKYQITIDD